MLSRWRDFHPSVAEPKVFFAARSYFLGFLHVFFFPYFLSLSFSFCAVNSVLVLGFGCKLHLILIYPQIWRPHPKKKAYIKSPSLKKTYTLVEKWREKSILEEGKETEKENNLLNKTLLQLPKEREYWIKKNTHTVIRISKITPILAALD